MHQSDKLTGAIWLLELVISSPLIHALVWPESSSHQDSNPGLQHERRMTYQSEKLTGAIWLVQLVFSSPLIHALEWPESSSHQDSNPGLQHEKGMTYQLSLPSEYKCIKLNYLPVCVTCWASGHSIDALTWLVCYTQHILTGPMSYMFKQLRTFQYIMQYSKIGVTKKWFLSWFKKNQISCDRDGQTMLWAIFHFYQ